MSDLLLRGVQAKLVRADQHFDEFKAAINGYVDRVPEFTRGEIQTESEGRDSLLLWMEERPQVEWSIIIGDFLHNLRSGLDHLVWQAVLASENTPGDETAFPVLTVRQTANRYGKHPLPNVHGGLRSDFRAVLDALQPYNAPDPTDHPLYVLHELSCIDKHRVIHTVIVRLQNVRFTYSSDPPETAEHIIDPDGDDDTRLVVFPAVDKAMAGIDEVNVYATARIFVALDKEGPAKGEGVLATMRNLRQYVADAVAAFEAAHRVHETSP